MRIYAKNKKFSQVITEKQMLKWKGNVILNGGTGTGKTYFVLEKLATFHVDKRFLYLVNRIKLYEEIERDIERLQLHNVELSTYQNIDTKIHYNNMKIENYDYIICDEFHYVVEDSSFNDKTQNSYDYILNHSAAKIFISATCNNIFNMFEKQKIVKSSQHYHIPKHYDYVEEFIFYKKTSHIQEIIRDILDNTNDKIVFFTHNISLGLKLHNEFIEDSILHCSSGASNKEAVMISNTMKNRLTNNTFDSRLLITTSALDNGINLVDRNIKHIICSMYNPIQLEQCLGRKRVIDKDDTCKFYFYDRNIGQFNYIKHHHIESIKPITMRKIKGFFDNLTLDIIRGRKLENGRYIKGIGFKNYTIDKLNLDIEKVINYSTIQKENKSMELETYLNRLVGKKLFKDEQLELIEMVDVKVNGTQQKSYRKLNDGLTMINLKFVIIPKKSGNVRYWIIEKIEE